ncbi:MAG: DUF1926 domain-containing protein [Calditrichia bacterium]
MKRIYFAFGIHCHQPVGNFDFVFEDAYRKSYKPFLDIVEKFPDFKLNVHYTGILLDWIKQHYPEHIQQLKRLGERGQVEHMSGGFYEPIISVIPRSDAVGQIRKQSDWIEKEFNQKPRGMWLAERVWEPVLPSTMHQAGMEYSVIDDAHFKYSGLQNEDLLGYYLTEDSGKPVRIFPISQKLRYTIPFEEPEVTLEYLRSIASEDEDRLIVFADDGEKFGVWPGTFDFVYGKKWLERFIQLILENRDWIKLVHFSEAIDQIKPMGRVYLPTASYAEMMHWALLPKAFRDYEDFEHTLKDEGLFDKYGVFVRGGFWRNFLAKYPESNQMHKKMLFLSERAWKLKEAGHPLADQALDHIWAGQCNCPYWHGVFGGLYLGHIRHAIYQHLIEADKILRKAEADEKKIQIFEKDYNLDGYPEMILETPNLNLYLEPANGGRIAELDYLPANFNLLNTMSRREEGYHYKLVELANKKDQPQQENDGVASIHDLVLSKEEGLEKHLNYDKHERKSLIEHFLPIGVSVEDFKTVNYQELAELFKAEYQVVDRRERDDKVEITLRATTALRQQESEAALTVKKHLTVYRDEDMIDVVYSVKADRPVSGIFGVEFNFALLAGYADDRYYLVDGVKPEAANLASIGEVTGKQIALVDEYSNLKAELLSDERVKIWRLPIETISLSEAGFERVYQSSAVVFLYEIEQKQTWSVNIRQKVGSAKA